jgi:hypothetical protein
MVLRVDRRADNDLLLSNFKIDVSSATPNDASVAASAEDAFVDPPGTGLAWPPQPAMRSTAAAAVAIRFFIPEY